MNLFNLSKKTEAPATKSPAIILYENKSLRELMGWFQSSPYDITIHKNCRDSSAEVFYSVTAFDWNPYCSLVVHTDHYPTLIVALEEAKIRLDAYIETKKKIAALGSGSAGPDVQEQA